MQITSSDQPQPKTSWQRTAAVINVLNDFDQGSVCVLLWSFRDGRQEIVERAVRYKWNAAERRTKT